MEQLIEHLIERIIEHVLDGAVDRALDGAINRALPGTLDGAVTMSVVVFDLSHLLKHGTLVVFNLMIKLRNLEIPMLLSTSRIHILSIEKENTTKEGLG